MANAAYSTRDETTAWLAERQKGIGSSDAAAVCGLDPYRSALECYVEKTSPLEEPEELPLDDPRMLGLLFEPVVARMYELTRQCTELAKPLPVVHKRFPWMRATPDRISDDGRIVELKTANSHMAKLWGEPGTDQIPEQYLVQCQHQMIVCDIDVADVAVLIAGHDFHIYTVRRSTEVADHLIEIEAEFWRNVERREPPEIDWSHPATPALVSRLHRPNAAVGVSLPDECGDYARAYVELGQQIKQLETDRELAKARIVHALGEAGEGHVNGFTITRKIIPIKESVRKAYEQTRFTVKAPKSLSIGDLP